MVKLTKARTLHRDFSSLSHAELRSLAAAMLRIGEAETKRQRRQPTRRAALRES